MHYDANLKNKYRGCFKKINKNIRFYLIKSSFKIDLGIFLKKFRKKK